MKSFIILRASNNAEKSIFVDFDGVLATYSGDYRKNKFGEPIYEMIDLLNDLSSKGIKITVWTARSTDEKEALEEWLKENNVPYDELLTDKPKFDVLVDDRVLTFNGDVTDVASQIGDFEPYWEKQATLSLIGPGYNVTSILRSSLTPPDYLEVRNLKILTCKGHAEFTPPDPSVGWNHSFVSLDLDVSFELVLECKEFSNWDDYFRNYLIEDNPDEDLLRLAAREIVSEDLRDSVLLAVLKECLPEKTWDLAGVHDYPYYLFPYRIEIVRLALSEDSKYLTLTVRMEVHSESGGLTDFLQSDINGAEPIIASWYEENWETPNNQGYLEEVLASLPLSEDVPIKSKDPIPQDGVFSPPETPVKTLKKKEKEKNIDVEQFDTGLPSNTYKRS